MNIMPAPTSIQRGAQPVQVDWNQVIPEQQCNQAEQDGNAAHGEDETLGRKIVAAEFAMGHGQFCREQCQGTHSVWPPRLFARGKMSLVARRSPRSCDMFPPRP